MRFLLEDTCYQSNIFYDCVQKNDKFKRAVWLWPLLDNANLLEKKSSIKDISKMFKEFF